MLQVTNKFEVLKFSIKQNQFKILTFLGLDQNCVLPGGPVHLADALKLEPSSGLSWTNCHSKLDYWKNKNSDMYLHCLAYIIEQDFNFQRREIGKNVKQKEQQQDQNQEGISKQGLAAAIITLAVPQ
jgi:hypothetical protein